MFFKNLWHKYSAEHGTKGALSNNDRTEFTIRIATQANLGFRDFMKFQSHFLKFRSEICFFFKGKVVFGRIECYQRKLYVVGLCFTVFDDSLQRHGNKSCMVGMGQIR